MTSARLPEGGKAWFERRGGPWSYQLVSVSPAGWVVTGAYVAASIALSLLIFAKEDDPQLTDWIVWAVLLAAMTMLFAVTALRMSVPAAGTEKGRRKCS